MDKYKLFLDDIRYPRDAWRMSYRKEYLMPEINEQYPNGWIIVRSYNEFIDKIKTLYIEGKFPELISFDHDLADIHYQHGLKKDTIPYETYIEKTGYDCAKWLTDFCTDNNLKLPEFLVHSQNPVGRENITSYLINYQKSINENQSI